MPPPVENLLDWLPWTLNDVGSWVAGGKGGHRRGRPLVSFRLGPLWAKSGFCISLREDYYPSSIKQVADEARDCQTGLEPGDVSWLNGCRTTVLLYCRIAFSRAVRGRLARKWNDAFFPFSTKRTSTSASVRIRFSTGRKVVKSIRICLPRLGRARHVEVSSAPPESIIAIANCSPCRILDRPRLAARLTSYWPL
jgi:hypothetical protein